MVETVAKIYSFGVIGWQVDSDPTIRHGDNWILKKLKIKDVKSPYFGDPWCMFDFFVVALSVIMTFSDLGDVLAPLKLLRVLRVFRLVKKIKQLQVSVLMRESLINSRQHALQEWQHRMQARTTPLHISRRYPQNCDPWWSR